MDNDAIDRLTAALTAAAGQRSERKQLIDTSKYEPLAFTKNPELMHRSNRQLWDRFRMSIIVILSAVTIADQSLWLLLKHQGANSTPPIKVDQDISSVDRISDTEINACTANPSNWSDHVFNLIYRAIFAMAHGWTF